MKEVYGLMADIHLHNWSAFATFNEDGTNSRLMTLIEEIERCAEKLSEIDEEDDVIARRIFIAGDLFHVRGKIAPSVINPLMHAVRNIDNMGIDIYIMAGNHDLEFKENTGAGNACQLLDAFDNVHFIKETTFIHGSSVTTDDITVVMIPWIDDLEELQVAIIEANCVVNGSGKKPDLILHAPVICEGGFPTGLTAEWLHENTNNFANVFCGHYHEHRVYLEKDGRTIWSIGAIAHHTWNDVDKKAGWMLVESEGNNNSKVTFMPSHAPKFVDVKDIEEDELDFINKVSGNYVRLFVDFDDDKQIKEVSEFLKSKCGVAGLVIYQKPKTDVIRSTEIKTSATISLDSQTVDFINEKCTGDKAGITKLALEILAEAKGKIE